LDGIMPIATLKQRLAKEIGDHRRWVALAPDRHERVAALGTAIKDIDRVIEQLGSPPRALSSVIKQRVLPALGEILAPSALESLAGSIAWGVPDEVIDGVNERKGRGNVTAFDELTRATRQTVASEIGPKLLVSVFGVIKAPLARALRLEKSAQGGRPQDLYRNYAVQELANLWEAERGTPAPGGKTGPFYDLCHDTLEELGLSTDGLADCIRRTTKQLRASRAQEQNPT
jgi:hypothetical protein